MTTDLDHVVRRAFEEIFDAAGDLGPCPTLHDVGFADSEIDCGPYRSLDGVGGRSTLVARRWVAIAAGLLLVVGVGGIAWIAQRPDAATTSSSTIDLGPVDQFEPGTITAVDDPPMFVVNDPSTGIAVLDARSPHLECVLVINGPGLTDAIGSPDPDVEFIDPCHGSVFDRAGNKLAGPAPRSMDSYGVAITDQRVYVDLSHRIPGHPATVPNYPGEDLDTTLPLVGRAWADSMAFSLEPETNARLYNAWQHAIADCMHVRGYDDWQPTPYPPNSAFEDQVNPLDRRYATVMGYHELPAVPVDPNTYLDDDTYVAAGECANVAYAETYERITDYITVNDQLRSSLSASIDGFADSDVGRVATSRWVACMAERGHDYESRIDAIVSYADRPTISAEEITTRIDDLDCDVEVGYTQAQHDWEQTQIDAWRQNHLEAIAIALDQKQLVEQQLAELERSQSDR